LRRGTTPSREKEYLVERSEAFAGRLVHAVIDRVSRPDGTSFTREVVLHPGAVAILPLLHDGRILLVRQYRHPVGTALWEIPAGKLEQGEDALACAKRELLEETGYAAACWEKLLSFFTSPGFCDEQITLFLARDLEKVAEPIPGEIDSQELFDRQRLQEMIESGEIRDGKSLLALLLAEIHSAIGTQGDVR
jgi:ADP-ribose pyrophosphatase